MATHHLVFLPANNLFRSSNDVSFAFFFGLFLGLTPLSLSSSTKRSHRASKLFSAIQLTTTQTVFSSSRVLRMSRKSDVTNAVLPVPGVPEI